MWWTLLLNLLSKLPDLITNVNLLDAAFTGVSKLVGLVYSSIKSHWHTYLVVLFCGLLFSSGYGWHRDHDLLLKERAAHQLDIKNFKQAQADADTKAKQVQVSLQKESKANADQADAKYSALLTQYRINIVRYKAGQSGSGQADHSQLQSAQGSDGPSTGSDVPSVVISEGDAQICAVNTARLLAVHDWATNPPKDGQ